MPSNSPSRFTFRGKNLWDILFLLTPFAVAAIAITALIPTLATNAAVTANPAASSAMPAPIPAPSPIPAVQTPDKDGLVTAGFAAGCFWCTQAVLQRLPGVKEVTCGYEGGTKANPTYEDVCTGTTGHAESVRVKFDPKVITYDQLLDWFWRMHDPTTKDRQGADSGTQYRSAIFYYDEAQRDAAKKSLAAAQKNFKNSIVTEITAVSTFYPAEGYHQNYFNTNTGAGYCQVVIAPKLEHLGLPETATFVKPAK